MSSRDIVNVVKDLINKAQGYDSKHKGSGKEAEAVDHSIPTDAPKADEKEKETNKANSGTHPEKGGKAGDADRHEGGEDFKDGSEDTIGSEGKASPGRPGTIKHEHTEQGPDHPGTATGKQKQQKSKDEEDLKKAEKADDEEEEEKEEKSSDPEEIFIDIDEFSKDVVKKAVEELEKIFEERFEKSHGESDFVSAAFAKSLDATLDRVEEVEKAVSNIARVLNVRKSLVRDADKIEGVINKNLESKDLSKSEISSKLFDLRMAGDPHVTDQMILRYDGTGDLESLPKVVKSKLGIE